MDAGLSPMSPSWLIGREEARVLELIELRFRFEAALRELVQPGPRRVTAPSVPGFCPGLKFGSGWPMRNAALPGQQQRFHQRGIENRGGQMSTSVLYMSMSLDGYIAGPND